MTNDELAAKCAETTTFEGAIWIISANWSQIGREHDPKLNQAMRDMVERLTWKAVPRVNDEKSSTGETND